MRRVKITLFILLVTFGQAWSSPKFLEHPDVAHLISVLSKSSGQKVEDLEVPLSRVHTMAFDLIDQIAYQLNRKDKKAYRQFRNKYQANPHDFIGLMEKLKELLKARPKLAKRIDKRVVPQKYSLEGNALLPHYKMIDFRKIKRFGHLRRINRFNRFSQLPFRAFISSILVSWHAKEIYFTPHLTVEKLRKINNKKLERAKNLASAAVATLYRKQLMSETIELASQFASRCKIKRRLKSKIDFATPALKMKCKTPRGDQIIKRAQRLWNVVAQRRDAQQIWSHLSKIDQTYFTRNQGLFTITPLQLASRWEKVIQSLKQMTLLEMIDSEDSEYIYLLRKWLKKNSSATNALLAKKFQGQLPVVIDSKKMVSRAQAISILEIMVEAYPDQPWLGHFSGTVLDRKGSAVNVDKARQERRRIGIKRFLTKLSYPENIISWLAAGTVTAVTGGNASFGLMTRNLLKNALKPLRLDTDWKEFWKTAPMEVVQGLVYGSGFSPGRFMKILGLGMGSGAIQSLATGQDPITGMMVGGGLNLFYNYVLPMDVSRPMLKGFSAADFKMNRVLEFAENVVKKNIQAAVVGSLTGQSLGSSLLRATTYAFLSTGLKIWFFGTRFYPFAEYSDADIDEFIRLENEFQNLVGRGGEYKITRQLILDANHRVNGYWTVLASASTAFPGTVSLSYWGSRRLSTLVHEASHLMQQHQSGVFGFYLLRYFPSWFVHGYDGHPDENFMRDVLTRPDVFRWL